MSAAIVAVLVLACTLGGARFGMWLRHALPAHHLDEGSRDVVKSAMGLIVTLTALVLGLVIASAKSVFDEANTTMQQSAARVLTIDRSLARYGPETADIRKSIRLAVAARLELIWPGDRTRKVVVDNPEATPKLEEILDRIRALSPGSEAQRWLQSQALQLGSDELEARWLILDSASSSIPVPFLGVLIAWMTLIFTSFGLFAPRHATVFAVLSLCALSVAAAVFLMLELEHPYDGLIKISADPVRYALSHLDQ